MSLPVDCRVDSLTVVYNFYLELCISGLRDLRNYNAESSVSFLPPRHRVLSGSSDSLIAMGPSPQPGMQDRFNREYSILVLTFDAGPFCHLKMPPPRRRWSRASET
jgi:hypothetical protein